MWSNGAFQGGALSKITTQPHLERPPNRPRGAGHDIKTVVSASLTPAFSYEERSTASDAPAEPKFHRQLLRSDTDF